MTEGTLINHPAAGASPNWPNIHGEAALQGWARVAAGVHEAGGKIIPQLWHVGTTRKVGSEPNPEVLPIGPSGLDLKGEKDLEPLTVEEIGELVVAYAQAAADAKRIGFDGIELHGAHGYLIDQFFWRKRISVLTTTVEVLLPAPDSQLKSSRLAGMQSDPNFLSYSDSRNGRVLIMQLN